VNTPCLFSILPPFPEKEGNLVFWLPTLRKPKITAEEYEELVDFAIKSG